MWNWKLFDPASSYPAQIFTLLCQEPRVTPLLTPSIPLNYFHDNWCANLHQNRIRNDKPCCPWTETELYTGKLCIKNKCLPSLLVTVTQNENNTWSCLDQLGPSGEPPQFWVQRLRGEVFQSGTSVLGSRMMDGIPMHSRSVRLGLIWRQLARLAEQKVFSSCCILSQIFESRFTCCHLFLWNWVKIISNPLISSLLSDRDFL